MRHTEFMHLKMPKQVNLLYKKAVYIGKRKVERSIVVLYQLEGFYVEIFYLKYRWHISRINAFESVDLLDPYLQGVDVEELINY